MNAYQLLELFGRHAVVLEVDGDKLRCKAPRGFLNDEMLQALKQHKAELIALLSGTDPPRSLGVLPGKRLFRCRFHNASYGFSIRWNRAMRSITCPLRCC